MRSFGSAEDTKEHEEHEEIHKGRRDIAPPFVFLPIRLPARIVLD